MPNTKTKNINGSTSIEALELMEKVRGKKLSDAKKIAFYESELREVRSKNLKAFGYGVAAGCLVTFVFIWTLAAGLGLI